VIYLVQAVYLFTQLHSYKSPALDSSRITYSSPTSRLLQRLVSKRRSDGLEVNYFQ
jgi:hypothetical protein